ncbi:MAG: TetR/AcrR family transcriptional regulator [Solirubrobacterales bacterium]|nr:TetR/AcrR family transcriptional regulator [Solirubrobacterales bacterium]
MVRGTVKADQRRRILRATGELVAKRGYAAVTVELIIKRAKVSFKTFYNHFSGKEECFLELFDAAVAEGKEKIEAALAAEPRAPWPRQVALVLRALFEAILADPLIARATIVEGPTVGPAIVERYEAAMKGLSPLLGEGRGYDPRAKALPSSLEDTLAGGVLWSAYQRLIDSEVDRIEVLLPESIEFVLRPYIGTEEATRWARFSTDPLAAAEDPAA